MIASKISNAFTLAATAASAVYARVLLCVLVTVGAMGYCSGGNLPGFYGSRVAESATKIHDAYNGLQMLGVDAGSNATQVVKVQAIRDGADVQFVGDAVRPVALAFVVSHFAVATAEAPEKEPATRHRLWAYQIHQTSNGRQFHSAILPDKPACVMNLEYYMANFTAQMDAQQASTTAQVWSGQLTSLCTIQQPDGNRSPDNAPSGNYVNVAGLVNIPCKDAVLADGSIQATEAKELEQIMSKSFRHVFLNGYYPILFTGAVFMGGPGGQQMGWQAVVDGITYDLLGAEPDSFGTQTRLRLQLATISNQGAG